MCTATPDASTTRTTSIVSARVAATGFSQKVGNPAATAARRSGA